MKITELQRCGEIPQNISTNYMGYWQRLKITITDVIVEIKVILVVTVTITDTETAQMTGLAFVWFRHCSPLK